MLRIKDLEVYHGSVQVLRGISFTAGQGKIMAVLGANGAGKSTLLGSIAGLYRPAKGEILFKNQNIAGQTPERIVRQGISLVPENREIFGNLTVLDNLLLGAFPRYRREKAGIFKEVKEVLELFPALKGREKNLAGSLSGGLQQMLAIGRGLMARPGILLLDEPSVGLAPMIVNEIMVVLRQLKQTGVTIIVVEQNTKSVHKIADEAVILERGQITLQGNPSAIIADESIREAYLGRTRM